MSLRGIAESSAAVAAGLAFAGIVLLASGVDPVSSIVVLATSFTYYPDIFMVKASIYMLTGLAFSIPLRAGFFNIGAEGQLYAGALASLAASLYTGNPLAGLAAGAALGSLAGLVPGVLRVRAGVNEVVTTIMVNWIVYWSGLYLVVAVLADPVYPHLTREVPESARIPWVMGVPGILAASTAISLAAHAFLYHTAPGLRFRVMGSNVEAARVRGSRIGAVRVASMAVAGGLAGLAGALLLQGHSYRIDSLLSGLRNYGFEGIGAALIGRNHPLGIAGASLVLAGLSTGSERIQITHGIPPELAEVVVGVIIVVLAAPEALRTAYSRLSGGRGS